MAVEFFLVVNASRQLAKRTGEEPRWRHLHEIVGELGVTRIGYRWNRRERATTDRR